MLSYRHAFHAGNHADVLKHIVLMLALDHLKQKPKPLWYIDTHAGAGCYALDSAEADKNAEYRGGIAQLLRHRDELPALLAPYLAALETGDADALRTYPGSPLFAASRLDADDRLRLFELHPQDRPLLAQTFAGDRRAVVAASDGFASQKALLPTPSRRALVLIDPPYELKEDYARVVASLRDALRRFATGVYLVWYPLLPRAESRNLPRQLAELSVPALRIELQVCREPREFGMFGSGMWVIHPPWRLRAQMQTLLPLLQQWLGVAGEAAFVLEETGCG